MTQQLCKKHNKPREVIYQRKMPNGAIFSMVGCSDCAAAAADKAGVQLKGQPAKTQERTENLRRI